MDGSDLRSLRLRKGLSVEIVGLQAGLHPTTLRQIEEGSLSATHDYMAAIERIILGTDRRPLPAAARSFMRHNVPRTEGAIIAAMVAALLMVLLATLVVG